MSEIKLNPNTSTKYQMVKRCLNCAYINPKSSMTCSGCHLMLVSELSESDESKDSYFRKKLPDKGEKADKELFTTRQRRDDE